ncbi:MAG TPA: LytR C-terminal domain-containing protein [Marmoricola sp.]|nr:LytR C-terminal domain-containing protein [Marmoricola sp.]
MTGRHLTTGVTLVVLLGVLAGMAVWGWRHVTAPIEAQQAGSQESCSPAEITRTRFVRPGDVQVSVYNAGHRSGLAGRTMTHLEARGFRPGEVGNARKSMHVRRAVVHTTKKDDAAAKLVARTLGRHVRVVVTKTAGGPGVDVFVGNRFRKLAPHAPRKMKLPKPVTRCVPVQ